jgi:protein-S-isoprenylcysteine O-methyltransferase Ste14
MKKSNLDHPNIAVFPPLIPLVTLIVSLGLQWLSPLGWIARIGEQWRMEVAVALIVLGFTVTITGRRALMRHETNVSPLQPTSVLVTDAAFRWTRNPLYVGVIIAQFGIALLFAIDWLALLIIPSCFLLHFAVVVREEHYLEHKFGDEYLRYKARVPRYAFAF